MVTINGIHKIDNNGGAFVVLADYHSEGLGVICQCETVDEAVRVALGVDGDACVVQLVRFDVAALLDGTPGCACAANPTK